MAMNKAIIKLVCVGVGGFAAGATGGMIFATRKCKKKAEGKIATYQAEMTKLAAQLEEANKPAKKEKKDEETAAAPEGHSRPVRRRDIPDYTKAPPKIYEIDEKEFDECEWPEEYYTYNPNTDILVDVRDVAVEDGERKTLIGDIDLHRKHDDVVYIRNDNVRRVIEVTIDSDLQYEWGDSND